MASRGKSRSFKITLRTLLLLFVVAGIGFAWVRSILSRHAREQTAIAELATLGCFVGGDSALPRLLQTIPNSEVFERAHWIVFEDGNGHRQRELEISPESVDRFHEVFPSIAVLTGVTSLDCRASLITDADLRWIAKLPHLTSLNLAETVISDEGIRQLGDAHIQVLSLADTAVSDKGLESLRVASLRELDITNTHISAGGLKLLTRNSGLQILCLGGTRITDDCIEHIRALNKLETLTIRNSQITPESLSGLQVKRLHLTINFYSILRLYEFEGKTAIDVHGARVVVDCLPPKKQQEISIQLAGDGEQACGVELDDLSLNYSYQNGVGLVNVCGATFALIDFGTQLRYADSLFRLDRNSVVELQGTGSPPEESSPFTSDECHAITAW